MTEVEELKARLADAERRADEALQQLYEGIGRSNCPHGIVQFSEHRDPLPCAWPGCPHGVEGHVLMQRVSGTRLERHQRYERYQREQILSIPQVPWEVFLWRKL